MVTNECLRFSDVNIPIITKQKHIKREKSLIKPTAGIDEVESSDYLLDLISLHEMRLPPYDADGSASWSGLDSTICVTLMMPVCFWPWLDHGLIMSEND